MKFDLLTPPPGPQGAEHISFFAVARPIYVSNSHSKFNLIESNRLGGDTITVGQAEVFFDP